MAAKAGVPFCFLQIVIMTHQVGTFKKVGLLLLLLAFLAVPLACGGGDEDGEDLSEGLVFNFDDTDESADGAGDEGPVEAPNPFARLTYDDGLHGRVAYVYDVQAFVAEMEQSRRDMIRLLERAQEAGGSVEWVAQVHDAHRVSEDFRIRTYNYVLSEELAEEYVDFHAAFLEAVQLYSHGADRMLQAAIVVGPGGRNVGDLLPAERTDFQSLLSEGGFYLADAEVLTTRTRDDLKELVKYLRVR